MDQRAVDVNQRFAFLHRDHVAGPDFVEYRLRGHHCPSLTIPSAVRIDSYPA